MRNLSVGTGPPPGPRTATLRVDPSGGGDLDTYVRKLSLFLSLAVALVLGAALISCQKAPDTIKIGLAAVQSGSDAQIGATMLYGSQIAVDEWNAKGGVLGKQIETISLDDEGNPQKANTVAHNLVDDGVVAVIGHLNSNCTIPASIVYNAAKIIQITPRLDQSSVHRAGLPLRISQLRPRRSAGPGGSQVPARRTQAEQNRHPP